jgi:hypothetical protein
VVTAEDATTVQRQLVGEWWAAGGPQGGIIIALRRSDVRALNRLARATMLESGRVAGREFAVGGEPFGAGDSIVLRQNDGRLGVANGDRGTVLEATADALLAEVGGRRIRLTNEYLNRTTAHGDPVVAHGYAVTGHVAQGLTAERAFVLASDLMYREWAYTAMSRGRQTNRLYMVGMPDRSRDEIAPSSRRTPDEELLAGLRRSRAQLMANDVGTPESEELQRLTDERARIETQLQDEPQPRRWWRGAGNTGRGSRALLENRLRELDAEEARLREPAQATDMPITTRAHERVAARDSLGR